jgi:multidrug efflux pump subunit AcrB
VLGALSGSTQTSPNFWVDPKNGVNYQVNVMSPQYTMDSVNALMNLPVIGSAGLNPQIVGNLAQLSRASEQPLVTHYNIQPVVDIYGAVDGKDLDPLVRK